MAISAAKLRETREGEKRGLQGEMGHREALWHVFVWRMSLTFQNCRGQQIGCLFAVVASAPSFIAWVVLPLMLGSSGLCILTSLLLEQLLGTLFTAWDGVIVTVCAEATQWPDRDGNTTALPLLRCCSHVLPLLSHPSLQPSIRMPFLVCHFVVGNVQQLAAQTSDCFLVFAFSFIYYSSFLLVLDVCKSSSFEMWREHWAWNAWWWWHLGFFMLVFAWTILCMKGGADEPGGEGWDLWTGLHGCHLLKVSWLLCETRSHPRTGLPERWRMLKKRDAWMLLDN